MYTISRTTSSAVSFSTLKSNLTERLSTPLKTTWSEKCTLLGSAVKRTTSGSTAKNECSSISCADILVKDALSLCLFRPPLYSFFFFFFGFYLSSSGPMQFSMTAKTSGLWTSANEAGLTPAETFLKIWAGLVHSP